ncbi:MAG: MerR family transcriptional regulator [Chloroflexota bacterium]
MSKQTYQSQEIADITGLPISTLRYYERIGLLDPVERAENGHRLYSDRDILRVEFLKRVRATGMSIKEMQHYVNLYREGESTLIERKRILSAHRATILAQIDELQDTVDFLDMKIDRYTREEHSLSEKENTLVSE